MRKPWIFSMAWRVRSVCRLRMGSGGFRPSKGSFQGRRVLSARLQLRIDHHHRQLDLCRAASDHKLVLISPRDRLVLQLYLRMKGERRRRERVELEGRTWSEEGHGVRKDMERRDWRGR